MAKKRHKTVAFEKTFEISVENIVGAIEEFLHRYKYFGENEEIVSMDLTDLLAGLPSGTKTILVPVKYIKEINHEQTSLNLQLPSDTHHDSGTG